ncbi:MAG TPA: hypothetical protein VGM86_33905, partial [Thermoanaerobaculia bacterium]
EDVPELVHPAEQVAPGRLVLGRGPRGIQYDNPALKLGASLRPGKRLQDRHDILIAGRLSRIPDGTQPDDPPRGIFFENRQDRVGDPRRVDDQDVKLEALGQGESLEEMNQPPIRAKSGDQWLKAGIKRYGQRDRLQRRVEQAPASPP